MTLVLTLLLISLCYVQIVGLCCSSQREPNPPQFLGESLFEWIPHSTKTKKSKRAQSPTQTENACYVVLELQGRWKCENEIQKITQPEILILILIGFAAFYHNLLVLSTLQPSESRKGNQISITYYKKNLNKGKRKIS